MEVVEQRLLDHIHFCFMPAGHTKFSPDRLFSLVASEYNRTDVFTPHDLHRICSKFASVHIEDGSSIFPWREPLLTKYSELQGVRKLHDFLIVRFGENVLMKVRNSCCKGNAVTSPLCVINHTANGTPTTTYLHKKREIPRDKMSHLTQMYSKFIRPEKWPLYISSVLPMPFQTTDQLVQSNQPSTSDSLSFATTPSGTRVPATSQLSTSNNLPPQSSSTSERSNPPPPKRSKVCSTPGCDGTRHRNKKRWNDGHTTRGGCPRIVR